MERHLSSNATRRAVLVGMAAALAPVARAQQREALRRVGALMGYPASDADGRAVATLLVQGLGALDWKEDINLRIDWRWAGSDATLFQRYSAELVRLAPEVLLAQGTPSVEALKRQTNTIPIVFTNVADPVGLGYAESLARPGGNITGFSSYDPPMAGKWMGLLTQFTPRISRVAVILNPATQPQADLMLRALEGSAPALGVSMKPAPCRDEAEIERVTADVAREGSGGLIILPDAFTIAHRGSIIAAAARYRLPVIYPYRLFADDGGLISYGVAGLDMYPRAAAYIDRILKGAKAGDLPVQAPTKFELVINLKTAKALGITVPNTLLATADEVIE